ncbi:MAG TPA: hypothetical protein VFI65_11955 [Streptosporangiaceae bacterium]|nr:hypothetical protein [Streptosporangiaceae bacterium]
MSGKKRAEARDRAVKAADRLKPIAEQMKPVAKSTGEAARRSILRSRAWAAPHLERTGKALQDTVAPKVSAALSSAAERIDPAKPRRGRWKWPVGLMAAAAAAASAAAAVFKSRAKTDAGSDTAAHDATEPVMAVNDADLTSNPTSNTSQAS